MKICIVGLPRSGKSSLFSALTGASPETSAAKGTDPIAVVNLTGASRLFGVPEHIRLEQSLFRTDDVTGRRPAGQLRGVYHRKTGQAMVDMDFVDGKRARGVSLMLDPVP